MLASHDRDFIPGAEFGDWVGAIVAVEEAVEDGEEDGNGCCEAGKGSRKEDGELHFALIDGKSVPEEIAEWDWMLET
jgi:hypothetical protein